MLIQPIKELDNKYEDYFVENLNLKQKVTFQLNKNAPIHRWFTYMQGFSFQLVDYFINRFKIKKNQIILDPFCGVGTTAIECQKRNINSLNVDISPLPLFLAKVKLENNYDLSLINKYYKKIEKIDFKETPPEPPKYEIFLKAYSTENLDKLLILREHIKNNISDLKTKNLFLVALLSIMERVSYLRKHGSHYRFINNHNAGVKHMKMNVDFSKIDVKKDFLDQLKLMIRDLNSLNSLQNFIDISKHNTLTFHKLIQGDARKLDEFITDPVDYVITSPPYLNRNNYIAQHKLELFFLDFVDDFKAYRNLTYKTFRSHVETKKLPDIIDDDIPILDQFIAMLEERKLSNPKNIDMVKGYFADLNHYLKAQSKIIHPNTKIAVVVGNVRWSGVMFPTDCIIAEVAEKYNYALEKIIITRYKGNSPQQMKKYGREPVRESIVILRGKE